MARRMTITVSAGWMALASMFAIAPIHSAYASTLTAQEIRSEMLGKTITTRRFGMRITMRYNPDRTVSARSALGSINGTWQAQGNRVCTTFPSGPAKGTDCVSFTRLGDNRYRSSAGVVFRVQ